MDSACIVLSSILCKPQGLLPFLPEFAWQILVLQLLTDVTYCLLQIFLVRFEINQRANILYIGLQLQLLLQMVIVLAELA